MNINEWENRIEEAEQQLQHLKGKRPVKGAKRLVELCIISIEKLIAQLKAELIEEKSND